jgi:hypothetical protein
MLEWTVNQGRLKRPFIPPYRKTGGTVMWAAVPTTTTRQYDRRSAKAGGIDEKCR